MILLLLVALMVFSKFPLNKSNCPASAVNNLFAKYVIFLLQSNLWPMTLGEWERDHLIQVSEKFCVIHGIITAERYHFLSPQKGLGCVIFDYTRDL